MPVRLGRIDEGSHKRRLSQWAIGGTAAYAVLSRAFVYSEYCGGSVWLLARCLLGSCCCMTLETCDAKRGTWNVTPTAQSALPTRTSDWHDRPLALRGQPSASPMGHRRRGDAAKP